MIGTYAGKLNQRKVEKGEVATTYCAGWHTNLSESLFPHLMNEGNNTHLIGLLENEIKQGRNTGLDL